MTNVLVEDKNYKILITDVTTEKRVPWGTIFKDVITKNLNLEETYRIQKGRYLYNPKIYNSKALYILAGSDLFTDKSIYIGDIDFIIPFKDIEY